MTAWAIAPIALLLWCAITASLIGWGLLATAWAQESRKPDGAIWWGLGSATIVVLALNFLVGLGSVVAHAVLTGFVIIGWLLLAAGWQRLRADLRWPRGWQLALLVTLGVLAAAMALWAMGVPGNYDTGLYHLGAIHYAVDHPVISGLANLHDRFGFNSSMWPLAAALDFGPWIGNGFRLIIGLLVVMSVTDLILRICTGRRWSPGTFVLAGGLVFALSAFAQYPARLVASSAQDAAALLLIVVATAYLGDAVSGRLTSPRTMNTAIVIAVLAALMRPLGWVYAVSVIALLWFLAMRRFGVGAASRSLLPGAVITVALGLLMLVRDTILSGWLLFPLAIAPMPVPWRAVDPWSAARDITGWARTPFQDVDVTLSDNSWIWGWIQRLPTDWSIPALLLLLGVLLALLFRSGARAALRIQITPIILTLLPATVTLVAWFVNAPDPRFAWGYILVLGLVPLAFVASTEQWESGWAILSMLLVAGLLLLAGLRGSFVAMAWSAQPVPAANTKTERLADGTSVLVPTTGDQCWNAYPLCTPWYAERSIRLRGDLAHGFESVRGT